MVTNRVAAMLDHARDYANQARNATMLRDKWICRAHAEGSALRTIGEAVGLSHTAIAKIVERGG